jgi:hypothetical protein
LHHKSMSCKGIGGNLHTVRYDLHTGHIIYGLKGTVGRYILPLLVYERNIPTCSGIYKTVSDMTQTGVSVANGEGCLSMVTSNSFLVRGVKGGGG